MDENNQEINNVQEKESYTQPNKSNNKKKKILIIVSIIVCLLIIGKIGLIILENYQKANCSVTIDVKQKI